MTQEDRQFISRFTDFCRAKGKEEYNFCNPNRCAVAQFGFPGLGSSGKNDKGEQVVPEVVMLQAVRAINFDDLAYRLEVLVEESNA